MEHVVIEGARPYDGRWELDLREAETGFTTREWSWIKRFSGYLPLTWADGLRGADAELIATFAVIALHRAKKIGPEEAPRVFEKFQDIEFGKITLDFGDEEPVEEEEMRPPPSSSSRNGGSSGDVSTTSSENSTAAPTVSGIPGSATTESDPLMSLS